MSMDTRLKRVEGIRDDIARAEIVAWLEQASNEEIYAVISLNLPGKTDASKMDPEELKLAMREAGFPAGFRLSDWLEP